MTSALSNYEKLALLLGPPRGPFVRDTAEEKRAIAAMRILIEDEAGVVGRLLKQHPGFEEWDLGTEWADVDAAGQADAAGREQGGGIVDMADVSADVISGPSSTAATDPDAMAPPRAVPRLTTGALGGFRGMGGYHRVFYNAATGETASVLFLNRALSGWPLTAHGGALATILDEALGRCAISTLPARTGVTARLELQYRAPVMLPGVYTVECRPDEVPPAADSPQAEVGGPGELRKLWCTAELRSMDGKLCVVARGLFVVPRSYALARVKDRF